MLLNRRHSSVCLATLFVVLACAALIGVDGWRTWQARERMLAQAAIDTGNMAQALARHADDIYQEADLVLRVVQEHIAEDGLDPKSLQRIHRQLVMQVNELPQLNGIFVYDQDGRWLVNSQQTLDTTHNNADRSYFIHHRDHADDLPYLGPPVQSKSTGLWIFTISRRITRADGSFGGVVLATISFDYFKRYYENFDVGHRGLILFALDTGMLLIRSTRGEVSTGQDLSNSAIFRDHASRRDRGSIELAARFDGEQRINSFVRLPRYPMFMTVAVSTDELLTGWRHDAYVRSIGILFLVGVLATMGRRLVRQIKRQARAEVEAVKARVKTDQLNATLVQLAMHDGLTGLANRRHFDRTLSAELARVANEKGPLALILIDVDYFKLYNDVYGHTKGDDCLKQIAAVIGRSKRRGRDLAARYGGEEFALVLPDCDIRGATALANTLRQSIAELRLPHSGGRHGHVSVSIGVAALDPVQAHDSPLALIESADQALYQAKAGGRDRIVTAPQSLKVIARDELARPHSARSGQDL
ncbi:diguanylate cyclase [Herbaspirillum sp. YR522]|uniref:sensor domain-containing diguanylate cyclase n=1 Tax=Herbaspirillum sp. YR522 TaxID=1144342 RepID=UPI00026F5CCB|nr:diguanylate cyclase [Herbaspirillum sp. YR522]EJN01760.1 diguanylate cyclase (GGDEF) domain-containing protein [Herbaspirillum sp. YR522]